jgi:hypothetical protein
MDKFLLKDSSGKKSTTMTAFVLGFIVVNAKLLLSGMTLGGLELAPFTGVEYAAAVSALGAIYVLRRSTDPANKEVQGES